MNLPLDIWRHLALFGLSVGRAVELSRALHKILWNDHVFVKRLVKQAGERAFACLKSLRLRAPAMEWPVELGHANAPALYSYHGVPVPQQARERRWVDFDGRRIYGTNFQWAGSRMVWRTGAGFVLATTAGSKHEIGHGHSATLVGDSVLLDRYGWLLLIDCATRVVRARWVSEDFACSDTHIASVAFDDQMLELRDARGTLVGQRILTDGNLLGVHGTRVSFLNNHTWQRVDVVTGELEIVADLAEPVYSINMGEADCLAALSETHLCVYHGNGSSKLPPTNEFVWAPGRRLWFRVRGVWYEEKF